MQTMSKLNNSFDQLKSNLNLTSNLNYIPKNNGLEDIDKVKSNLNTTFAILPKTIKRI